MVLPAISEHNTRQSAANLVNADHLVEAGRSIDVPFRLRLQSDDVVIDLDMIRILRLLPSKRIVGVARLDGDEVLVKVYLGPSARRYARREERGVRFLVQAGVRTPELKRHAHLTDGGGEVLVFEYLEDAVSLYDRWREAVHEDEKVDVLTRAMVIIGKLHNHGVVQNDIHLANFLLSHGRLYTIDGGDIVRQSRSPLSVARSLRNLGMFFGQFYPRYDDLVDIVLPAYEAVRGWGMDQHRVDRIARGIRGWRRKRKRTHIKKAFRECTRFVCRSSFDRFEVCERDAFTPAMADLLANLDQRMAEGDIIKDGDSSTVVRVDVDGRSFVIKRYNLTSIWHRLRRALRTTRAWTSWANAARMEFLGIPSLRPVAMVEQRFGLLRGASWFVTDYIEGPDALAYLDQIERPNGEAEALVELLWELSACRVSHGDMKATNFVMSEQGPVLIDLDAMREHHTRSGFRRAFRRDLRRFMKNWQGRPELSSRFAGLLENLSW